MMIKRTTARVKIDLKVLMILMMHLMYLKRWIRGSKITLALAKENQHECELDLNKIKRSKNKSKE